MVSLIATVFNEQENVEFWLDSLLAQSKIPDEIVIVDGGSNDGTWELLQKRSAEEPRLKIFQRTCNISQGRNLAIENARGDIIVVTDAGCVYDRDWFRELGTTVGKEGVQFAATAFGPSLKKRYSLLPYLIAAATTPAPFEFVSHDWLPSSRSVAFTKKIWKEVGGYPEWLPIGEDIVFDLKILKKCVAVEYVREPMVFWNPRPSLWAYFKQLYTYTKSDGHKKVWFPHQQLARCSAYGGAIVLIALAAAYSWWFLLPFFVAGTCYMIKYWRRFIVFSKSLPWGKRLIGFVLLPLVIASGDIVKISGWPVGIYQSLNGKIKFEAY
jgi:glycosyltransferase involved in cell wall biosynthesis